MMKGRTARSVSQVGIMETTEATSMRPIPAHMFQGISSPRISMARMGASTGLKKKTSEPCMAEVASMPMK